MQGKHAFTARLVCAGLFAGFLALGAGTAPAAAQGSSLFCGPGQTLVNGFCVRSFALPAPPTCPTEYGPVSFGPVLSACVGFSSAASATQSLSTSTRAIADQVMGSTLDAVRARREEESRCPAGMQLINGQCRPANGGRAFGYAPQEAYAADLGPGRMIVKSAPPPAASPGVQTAFWVQGFGDYEHRSEITPSTLPTLGGVTGSLIAPRPGDGVLSLTTDLTRTTWTGGVIGGLDWTFRNVYASSDALVVGVLFEYMSSQIKFTSVSNNTDLTGPSVGAYAAYVRGPWSGDLTFKTDFLTQNQTFSDFGTLGVDAFAISASASVHLTDYSVAGNLNYRIPLSASTYWEPTVGASYLSVVYGNGAAAVGLADTQATRVQGGARFGWTSNWGNMALNSAVTGLAYSYVNISGGSAIPSAVLPNGVVQTDEGKVFGQFLYTTYFDFAPGYSVSFGSDVRFGNDVIGVGLRGGFRHVW